MRAEEEGGVRSPRSRTAIEGRAADTLSPDPLTCMAFTYRERRIR